MSSLPPDFAEKYGPWALVCGASDGIGEAFAVELAKAGLNLVLLARRAPLLDELATRLSKRHSVEVRVLVADLSDDDIVRSVDAATADIEVGLLVYVSGSPAQHPKFLDAEPSAWIRQLRLNCDGPVKLGHHFGRKLRERGRGGMLFLSSLACLSGSAYQSLYTASKAFDQMFAESLWHELAPHGVDVMCLMVGATNTPTTNDVLGYDFDALMGKGIALPAVEVAREGLANLGKGPLWVTGELMRGAFPKLAPEARAAAVENASATIARFDGVADYAAVWDLEKGRRL